MKVHNDALAYIKGNPERFFRKGSPDPIELVNFVLGDALVEGASRVEVIRHDGWWLIGSDVDWLAKVEGHNVEELFTQIIPFPEAGVNSMRAEVLLAAFAEAVLTTGQSERLVVKGNVPDEAEVWHTVESNPRWKRAVAFKL